MSQSPEGMIDRHASAPDTFTLASAGVRVAHETADEQAMGMMRDHHYLLDGIWN